MWVLCHTSTFIGIQENVINIQRCSYQRFGVSTVNFQIISSICSSAYFAYSIQAFIHRTQFKSYFNFVVLQCNQWQGKTRVSTEPELQRNIQSGFWKCVTWSTYSFWNTSSTTSSCYICEFRIGQISQLSSITDHFIVTIFLFR